MRFRPSGCLKTRTSYKAHDIRVQTIGVGVHRTVGSTLIGVSIAFISARKSVVFRAWLQAMATGTVICVIKVAIQAFIGGVVGASMMFRAIRRLPCRVR